MAKPGRPTTYRPAYCEALVEYFEAAAESDPRELAPVTITEEGHDARGPKGSQKREVRRICAELPTFEGFARTIGVSTQTLNEWRKQHPEFSEAYARAKDIQKLLLIDRGLTRQYDPTAFIFVAKNVTDMTDKQVLAGDADAPLLPPCIRVELVKKGEE